MEGRFERLSPAMEICVSARHRFGTDAFLLADFAGGARGETACDLCSGCGIVACLLLRGSRAPARVVALEIQAEAVELMGHTVEKSGLAGRLQPMLCDLRQIPSGTLSPGSCALVTCNPPYQAAGTGLLSAGGDDALARHELMCTLSDVCAAAARLLRYGGRLCLCQRPQRLPDVLAAMRAAGIEPKALRTVHKRPDSAPWLILVEGRKGGKPFLKIHPPLFVQGEDGGPSQELLRIYTLA